MLKKGYNSLVHTGTILQSFFLLIVRLIWGYAFLITGLQKLTNIGGTTDMLTSLSFPAPGFLAYIVGFVELIGGICLILGLASRLVALILSILLFVALFSAHYSAVVNIFQNFDAFTTQSPIAFLLVTLMVFCFGPGRFSLDALIARRHHHKK